MRPTDAAQSAAESLLLESDNLACFRGGRWLFEQLNFAIQSGELVQIQGPNGSGKTTLLRVLCGLTAPTQGSLRWCGQPLVATDNEYTAQICYIGHQNGIRDELTVAENIRFIRALMAHSNDRTDAEALQMVALDRYHDIRAGALSAGQRRRLALTRTLISRARLWILDEPFTSLDAAGIRLIDQQLTHYVAAGGAVLLTGHHPLPLGMECQRSLTLGHLEKP